MSDEQERLAARAIKINALLDENELLRSEVAGTFQRVLELEAERRCAGSSLEQRIIANLTLSGAVVDDANRLPLEQIVLREFQRLRLRVGELEQESIQLQRKVVLTEQGAETLLRLREHRIKELEALQEKHRTRILELDERCHELEMAGRDMRSAQRAYWGFPDNLVDEAHARMLYLEGRFDGLVMPDSSVAEHPPDKREVSGSIPDSATDD